MILNHTGPRLLHGLPITPKHLLEQLAGQSFCVSFAAPAQLDRAIELVDPEGMLMLDNGAFSHWRAGRGQIDREAFFAWANAAQARCPVAVAALRRQWDPTDGVQFERRGSRYMIVGSPFSGQTRAQIVAQCVSLEAGMQEHHDEQADEQIQERKPLELARADWRDRDRHEQLALALVRMPRFARMQALAFVGLTDAEVA